MYSPRRRYRRYQSKKYYRNNLFAPSLKKAPAPNYYQMKGRILQQSPRLIQEPPTEIINRNKLDKMYETLVEYKYKFPTSPIDFGRFNFFFLTTPIAFSDLPVGTRIDKTLFQEIVDRSEKPKLPTGYHYEWDVTNIMVDVSRTGALDNSRFSFYWYSSVLSNGNTSLIQKTSDSTFNNSSVAMSNCIPSIPNQAMISRITFQASGLSSNYTTVNTTDETVTDDGEYPFITSLTNSEVTDSYFLFAVPTASDYLQLYTIRWRINVYIFPDS